MLPPTLDPESPCPLVSAPGQTNEQSFLRVSIAKAREEGRRDKKEITTVVENIIFERS